MSYFRSFLSTDLIIPIKVEKCSLLAAALSLNHGLNVINKPLPFFPVLFDSNTLGSRDTGGNPPPPPRAVSGAASSHLQTPKEQGSYYLAA